MEMKTKTEDGYEKVEMSEEERKKLEEVLGSIFGDGEITGNIAMRKIGETRPTSKDVLKSLFNLISMSAAHALLLLIWFRIFGAQI